jgi:hypothetical protein
MAKRIEAGTAHHDPPAVQKADLAVGVGAGATPRAVAAAAPPSSFRGCQSHHMIETAAAVGVGAGPLVVGPAPADTEAAATAARKVAPHHDSGPAVEDTEVGTQPLIRTGNTSQ